MKKILVTGKNGRFAKVLAKIKTSKKLIFTSKKELDITKTSSIKKAFKKFKPDCVVHLAGLSRPMSIHEKNIKESINLNIIGTCNLVSVCAEYKIKLIYFSTSYVYPGTKGNYKETDPILPWNNYAWSKLGGECAVQMYEDSLILRACMTEKPFIHKKAYANVYTSFAYHEEIAKIFFKLLNQKGIINLGGKRNSIYKFVKKDKKNILKRYSKGEFPFKQDININKLKKILRK